MAEIPPEDIHGDGIPAAAGMPGPPGEGLTTEQLARSLAAGTFVDVVWVDGEPHDPKRRAPDDPLPSLRSNDEGA